MTDNDHGSSGPLVSAVITTYNRPSHLRDAVESVLGQTYDDTELVVVDDHSETPARETLADVDLEPLDGFECIRHQENRGANPARNTGIGAARGEYVAFLDDDDQWVPTKLERQVSAVEDHDDIGVIYTGLKRNRPAGEEIIVPPRISGDITKALLCRNVIGSMSVAMVRTDLAESVPLDERFPSWADLEWYVRLSRRTRFMRIPDPLVVYDSTSPGRLTSDFEKERKSYELFVDEFDTLAAEYGFLFRRKMHGWAAFRVGKGAFYSGNYATARRFFATAIVSYPFEPQFGKFLLIALGGQRTHELGKAVKRVTS